MSKHNSLGELFTNIADAIREKTNSAEPIIADDFPEKIQEISGTIDYVNERTWSVGNDAYYGMSNLKSVHMPNVREIGYSAFCECENLESVTMSDNLTTIGSNAFHYCKKLKDIFIGNNVADINSMAFYYCENLTNIQLGTSLTNIGDQAFDGCNSLTDIIIPSSVVTIGKHAFAYCSNLTNITVSPDNPNYCSVYGNLFNKDKTTLIQYAIGKPDVYYAIPDGVITIGDSAFLYCHNLNDILIPDGVTTISRGAFWNCNNLTNINLPNSVTTIGESAFYNCESLTSITIPDGVTIINDNTFDYCPNLTRVTIPDSVTTIGNNAFTNCYSLIDISIPNSVTAIGGGAFNYCESLTSISIPNGVTEICSNTFYHCSNLVDVTIPDSVTTIGNNAFLDCDSLINIAIGNGVTNIDGMAFYTCDKLTNVIIPHSVTNIGDAAFGECPNLTDIYYYGTEEDWNNISIGEDNEYLTNATIHYIDDPSKQVCTIKYDGNGSNISIDNAMCVDGDTITLVYTQPTQFLHRFLGWSTTPDATEAEYQPGDSYTVTEDVTLYAVWEQTAQVKTLTYQAPETVDSAIISVGGEHYYFKFTPAESGYYTFSSTIPNGEGDGYCYLYDEQGSQLASDDDGAGNLNFNLGYYMEVNTTYYYGVKYWDSSFTGTIPVRLFMEVK